LTLSPAAHGSKSVMFTIPATWTRHTSALG
jgi:hypothetical protein